MLSDKDRTKLCRGRIVYADVLNSTGTGYKKRFVVMIESDEAIAENTSFYVAPISHNEEIDPTYLVPVPARTRLTGNIVCSWLPLIHENAIKSLKVVRAEVVLEVNEMIPINAMIKKYQSDKASKKGSIS